MSGELVIEGKTKRILRIPGEEGKVKVISKDIITAGDGARKNTLQGKAAISNDTNATIFEYLNLVGIPTHFLSRGDDDQSFIAKECAMIPIEWVTRRIATGSFLRRNPGVKEGYRFTPVKLETFFKDDENHDPQWSDEQIISAGFKFAGVEIDSGKVQQMKLMTVAVFEVLEKAWSSLHCSLVDMKIEFGVDVTSGSLLLADVIDSDSWRLWPAGDKRLDKSKQVYRDLTDVTQDSLQVVKRNFEWVGQQLKHFIPNTNSQVVIFMGSSGDLPHGEAIKKQLESLRIPCDIRISSAHKGTPETINILRQYEGLGIPLVIIAVAGRSNGLGPVLSGNTTYPVINCPPLSGNYATQDVWSSLRMPSGLGCSTVISTEGAALAAAQMIGLTNHVVWSSLRGKQLNTACKLMDTDYKTNH